MSPTLELETLTLYKGGHADTKDKMCVMEAVAFVAGEPWSDHPQCASQVIGAFLRRWNDDLDDEGRQILKPFIVRLVGTAGTPEQEARRAWMVTDWMIRVHLPAWLALAGMQDQADAVRGLAELVDADAWKAGASVVGAASERAAAARAAAGAAAGAAVEAAAEAAAWAAAWAAVEAAVGTAADAAAWAAPWAAADAAAGAAARAALRPTVVELQASALALLDRLIAVTEVAA